MNYNLACDAFESVRWLPTSAPLWRRLCVLLHGLEPAPKKGLVDAIMALPLAGNPENWLRCSALAFLTRDAAWLARQAALTHADMPADAIGVLLGAAWHHALTRTPGRHGFADVLCSVNAPRLQRLVAQALPAPSLPALAGQTQRAAGSALRVAIYTPQIVDKQHGGTLLTLNMMSLAARLGVECRVFSAQEVSIPDENQHSGGPETLRPTAIAQDALALQGPGHVPVLVASGAFSLRAKLAHMLAAVHDFAPDVLVFVGFMSPVVYRLHAHYPVLGLSVHAAPPLVPVDVWLSADPHASAALWPDLPAPQMAHYPYRFWPHGPTQSADLSALQLPPAAVVLVTAGYRLDVEMPAPWLARMLAFLQAHPQVHWLLVGNPAAGLLAHPRMHALPPTPALPACLAACHLYVNPPLVGGGGTVAMAMEQGLPVLTLADSDGGDKAGAWAALTPDAYFDQLACWVNHPAARQQAGVALQARFYARLDASGPPAQAGLLQACHQAIALFNQRRAAQHG